jgi:predicted nucleic acid-binding protein
MAVQLGDGEAACYAAAKTRGWMLATDDRRARKFTGQAGIPVITTPELVKLWAENTHPRLEDIITVLKDIQRFAYFVPRANSPEYAWWVGCLGQAGT